jgi:hypothetical protein
LIEMVGRNCAISILEQIHRMRKHAETHTHIYIYINTYEPAKRCSRTAIAMFAQRRFRELFTPQPSWQQTCLPCEGFAAEMFNIFMNV